MIQLYKSGNNDFSHNGDIVIEPISCILKCELNGIWEVELVSTLDCELITENAVISCDTPNGKNQLFRIYDISKTDNQIAALAYPIFIDSKDDVFIFDKRPTNKNGQQALDDLMQGTKYHGQSDIVSINSAYYINKNLIEALNSDDNQSFINRWGGECSYNNYTVTINNRIGSDNGARAEFGYNLIGIKEDINMLTVVTRIVPMAYNGHMLPRSETVDSPIVNNYPKIYTKVIKFEDVKLTEDAQEGETSFATLDLLYAELRKRSQKEFENGIDKPKISYDVDIIDLSRVDEYKYLSNLVKLHLGDTVHCKHRRLNIETNARVVSLTYDCVLNKVENLELGDYEPNYFNDVSATQNAVSEVIDVNNKSVLAEKIYGVMNAMNTQLKYQKDIAHKQDVRAILFEDLDTTSPTFGAMCIGSLGFQISSQRNTTNSDWVWSTFGTGKGFSASLLNAGTIKAIDIEGVNITGSNIVGTSSINVGTDLHVGNNISLGLLSELGKSINGGNGASIDFERERTGTWENWISLTTNDYSRLTIFEGKLRVSDSKRNYFIGDRSVLHDLEVRNFAAIGTKNRLVKTKSYGNVLFNALETPTAIFEDNGSGIINDEGICIISFDRIVQESTNTKCSYFVQLTKNSLGDLYCDEKSEDYFIVKGTSKLKFDWCVKLKQVGYETTNKNIYENKVRNTLDNFTENSFTENDKAFKNQKKFEDNVNNYYPELMKKLGGNYE